MIFFFSHYNHCIAGGLHLAYFQYVLHPNDTSLTAQNRNLPFVQKCFGAVKHFRSSTPHTSLDGSRIIKAIQTQNKALINTPSSGFEVRLRLKYLLVYIVVQVIVSCELFPIDKIQTIATENRCGQKRRELPADASICSFAKFQFCSKN